MRNDTVLPPIRVRDEDEFHASFMVLLARMSKKHTPAKVADALGYTTKRQLANLSNGSLPSLRGYYNLLALDASAHDELDADYGSRKVPKDAVCSTDPIAAKKAALLSKIIDAEDENSPGGKAVILHEILEFNEDYLRSVARTLNGYIDVLDNARKPALKAVRS